MSLNAITVGERAVFTRRRIAWPARKVRGSQQDRSAAGRRTAGHRTATSTSGSRHRDPGGSPLQGHRRSASQRRRAADRAKIHPRPPARTATSPHLTSPRAGAGAGTRPAIHDAGNRIDGSKLSTPTGRISIIPQDQADQPPHPGRQLIRLLARPHPRWPGHTPRSPVPRVATPASGAVDNHNEVDQYFRHRRISIAVDPGRCRTPVRQPSPPDGRRIRDAIRHRWPVPAHDTVKSCRPARPPR